MTATIYNGRGAPDAARTVSFALPAGDYSGLALTLDFLCNRIPAEIDGDGCCFATIPEEALRTIPCGTLRAALLLRGSNGQEAVFASVPIRVSDIPGEASAYADVESVTPSFAPANAVTADALAEALAAIDAPGTGATQMTLRKTLAALVTALKTISSAVAGFCLFSLAAAGESIPWEQVPPDTPVDPAALLPVAESDPTVHDWAKAANPPRETDPAFTEWARTNTYVKAETEPAFSEWVAGSTNEFGDVRLAAVVPDATMPSRILVYGGPSGESYEFSDIVSFSGYSFLVPAGVTGLNFLRLPMFAVKAGPDLWRLARLNTETDRLDVSAPFRVNDILLDGYLSVTFGDWVWLVTPSCSAVARMSDVAAATNNLAPPDLSGYATSTDLAAVEASASLVGLLLQGSNVVAEVTNYNSRVHAPELRLLQLNESNEYYQVWAETNGLARTLASAIGHADGATNALDAAKADRAWSHHTSGLGADAPDGCTWMSTPNTVLAGGLEFEKHVTTGGAIWILKSNGMSATFHAQTNNTAFLDMSSADGTPVFRVEKTDSYLVGVDVTSLSVSGDTLICGVNAIATEHPLARVRPSLTSGDWIKEEDYTAVGGVTTIPGIATIEWSGSSGAYVCEITSLTGGSSFFATMEYLQEGGTKIINSAPLDVSQGILCTDGIHRVRPVYNNGSVTWQVMQ